jgi:VPDSG-CTERM motif
VLLGIVLGSKKQIRSKKMKMRNITKWLGASAVFAVMSLATQRADAVLQMSYQNNSQYLIGTVIPGDNTQNGQVARDVAMTNQLLSMSAGAQTTLNNSLYSRTTWPAGPPATAVGAVAFDQNAITSGATIGGNSVSLSGGIVTITLGGTFQYLVAAYDGSHAGVAVFDISSFHAGDTIQLYAFAHPDPAHSGDLIGGTSGQYFMTSFTLLNPISVPDGGATVMLLGAALGALGVVRRYLIS